MSAFQASYSDFKIVKGRKVAQIILEVPLEAADNALAVLGGVPRPDAEVWVGVARLDPKATVAAPQAEQPAKERRRFDELPLPQQAALLCQDKRFQNWCNADGEGEAIEYLRSYCDIASRSQLASNVPAAQRFIALVAIYRQEMGMETERR